MMGSAAAMLLNAAPATNVSSTGQAETPALGGGNFLAALMATAAVAGVAQAADAQPQLESPVADADSSDDSASNELAAAIAAMLVGVAPAADGSADNGSGGDAEAGAQAAALQSHDGDSATAGADAALNRLLQALSQRLAGAADAAQSTNATAAANGAVAQPADAALVPLLSPARTAEAAAAALVAAAKLPEAFSAVEAPTQPGAQSLASTLASTMGPTPQSHAATTAATHTLHAAVGTPRWSDELGSRMVLMSLNGQHEGSLNLTPEHLGPLEVRLSVNQGTANVWFGSQHADTRAALAEALPRLRELFADAGLALGHAGVSHEAPRQQQGSEATRFAGSSRESSIEGIETVAPTTRRVALGLVDTYA